MTTLEELFEKIETLRTGVEDWVTRLQCEELTDEDLVFEGQTLDTVIAKVQEMA